MVVDATDVLPAQTAATQTAATRPATARPLTGRSRAAIWSVVCVGLLVGAVALIAAADDDGSPLSPTTTAVAPTTTPSTTVAPATTPPPPPAVDCAALQAEKDGLEAQKKEIMKQHRHDRETRDRLRGEVDARQQEIDLQLQEHCP